MVDEQEHDLTVDDMPPQLPEPPYRASHAKKKVDAVKWVAVGLSAVALLLAVTANVRVSMIDAGDNARAVASAPGGRTESSGSVKSTAKAKKQVGKTVTFMPKAGTQLEGDYDDSFSKKIHVKLVKLEAVGTKATLTTEIANNGTDSDGAIFTVTAFQNGLQTGSQFLRTDGQIQSGYTATVTTEFDIKDATQPVSLEVNMYSQTLRAEFDPQD